MKGSILWKLVYMFCGLAGCLAGYVLFTLTGMGDIKLNTITKDNTPARESGDSVFFGGTEGDVPVPSGIIVPTPVENQEEVSAQPQEPREKQETQEIAPHGTVEEGESESISSELLKNPSAETPHGLSSDSNSENEIVSGQAVLTTLPDEMPSLAGRWTADGQVAIPTPLPIDVVFSEQQNETAEVITYPVEIFGQVPVINRSDEYVSYFEFCYDLINMLEPVVEQRGMKLSTLLTRFVIKALFYGVDIAELNINAPIPRRQAALTLWLAAQLLGEQGCDTSAKSAGKYVTDIAGCSSPERKAVAYLYERGIINGYQVSGQKFYPNSALTTESGNAWLSGIKQCWK